MTKRKDTYGIKAGDEFTSPRGSTMKVVSIYSSSATNIDTQETTTWWYAEIEYNGERQGDIPIKDVASFADLCGA